MFMGKAYTAAERLIFIVTRENIKFLYTGESRASTAG
jgi:hypothetical protein